MGRHLIYVHLLMQRLKIIDMMDIKEEPHGDYEHFDYDSSIKLENESCGNLDSESSLNLESESTIKMECDISIKAECDSSIKAECDSSIKAEIYSDNDVSDESTSSLLEN